MIDQSINEIYQRDGKVFIPDFGAFIYSEITDTINFNALLTFDDGKVISEIQKQQNLAEEEARNALIEYVEQMKHTMNQGKSHHIEGIGNLSQDEQGVITIQGTKSSSKVIDGKVAKEPESKKMNELLEEKQEISESNPENNDFPEEFEIEAESIETQDDSDEEQLIDEIPEPESTDQEKETDDGFLYNPVLSEEDENVQEYNKRRKKLYNPEKKRSIFVSAMWIIIPILLLASAGYYYFNYYNPQEKQENNDKQTQLAQAVDDEKEENISNTLHTDIDVSKSDQRIKPAESSVNIHKPKSVNVSSSQSKIYSLILGSFKVESNADRLIQRLSGQGLEMGKFKRDNNFYFVGVEHIEGKSNAVKQLSKIKAAEPSAWIIKKL